MAEIIEGSFRVVSEKRRPLTPEEVVSLFGRATPEFRQQPQAEELWQAATAAERSQDRLVAAAQLESLVRRAQQGDAEAVDFLRSLHFLPADLSPQQEQEVLSQEVPEVEANVRAAQEVAQEAGEKLTQTWEVTGPSLAEAAQAAEAERLAAVGWQEAEAKAMTGPTLEQAAAELRGKKEELRLVEEALGGKEEARQALQRGHGRHYQRWQKEQLEAYGQELEGQVRQSESRFAAMRTAQQEKARQAAGELSEQIQSLTDQARAAQDRASRLEKVAHRLEAGGQTHPKELQELGVQIGTDETLAQAVVRQAEAEQQVAAEAVAHRRQLSAREPMAGQQVAAKMAGVEAEQVPQYARPSLVKPEFDLEALRTRMDPADQMLTVAEAAKQARQELELLNQAAGGDESARQALQEKGAPVVWKRSDLEAAVANREELLGQLEQERTRLRPVVEDYAARVKEHYRQAYEEKELLEKDPAAVAEAYQTSVARATQEVGKDFEEVSEQLSRVAAVRQAEFELEQQTPRWDQRAPAAEEVTTLEREAPPKDRWAQQAEFVRTREELAEIDKRLTNPEYLEKELQPQREKIQEQIGYLNRALREAPEAEPLAKGQARQTPSPFERQKELRRLQTQLKEADQKIAWVRQPAAELEQRGAALEEKVRAWEGDLAAARPQMEKEAALIEANHQKLLGYANQPDLLVRTYNKPLEEAEKEHAQVVAQSEARLNQARQFRRGEATLKRLSRPLDLKESPRHQGWDKTTVLTKEGRRPVPEGPEKPMGIPQAYLRETRGGLMDEKQANREMMRKQLDISRFGKEAAEIETQLGLASGKEAEKLGRRGTYLENKVRALETEIDNLKGISRVELVSDKGKRLASQAGSSASARVKTDLVGYGVVDREGNWRTDLSSEQIKRAETGISKNLYQDAASRSLARWEKETVQRALGGTVKGADREKIARVGLLGEERGKLASQVYERSLALRKEGFSERGALNQAIRELDLKALGQSAAVQERVAWIAHQAGASGEAVGAKLTASLSQVGKQGLAQVGPAELYRFQILPGQTVAGQSVAGAVRVGGRTFTSQPSYQQALAQAEAAATKAGFAGEIGRWHSTWQRNPLRATTELFLGETGTGLLWGDGAAWARVMPRPLAKWLNPGKYAVSADVKSFKSVWSDIKRQGVVRSALSRTLGVRLGLYRQIPIIKGGKVIGHRYLRADKYFFSAALDTVIKSPFRAPAGLLRAVFNSSRLAKFGLSKDILAVANLLGNPLQGGLVPWAARLGLATARVPLNLAGRTLGRVSRSLTARALVLLRKSATGRALVKGLFRGRRFLANLPLRLKLGWGKFLQGTRGGRFLGRLGRLGSFLGGAGKKLGGVFSGVGSRALGFLTGKYTLGDLALELMDKVRQLFEKVLKTALTKVAAAVAAQLSISLGWFIAGCACLGCLVVILVTALVLILGKTYCMYFPDFFVCRYLFGWPKREELVQATAVRITNSTAPSYALNSGRPGGSVEFTFAPQRPVSLTGLAGEMSYITNPSTGGRGGGDFTPIASDDQDLGSFQLNLVETAGAASVSPEARYLDLSPQALAVGETKQAILTVNNLRTDQDATYLATVRLIYRLGEGEDGPVEEAHSFVEIRIGTGADYGDDLFVSKVNSLATCVSSDKTVYRLFDAQCVPECALGIWTPWAGNLQCAVFLEGGQNCAGITPIYGDAYQWFDRALSRTDYATYTNGDRCPRRGDIIVWEGGAEGWGHVAAVTDDVGLDHYDCSGHIEITQANTPRLKMNLNVFQGWITAEGFEAAGFHIKGLVRRVEF